MSQASHLPVELLQEIFTCGVVDPHHGKSFGAKCMQLARWVQPIVAPLLYRIVIIKTENQKRSFTLALENGKEKAYSPFKLVHSLVVDVDRSVIFSPDMLYQWVRLLDKSTWKEVQFPPRWLFTGGIRNSTSISFQLPPSVTFPEDIMGYPIYNDYSRIVKLRFLCTKATFRDMAGLVRGYTELAPNLSHLAITIYDHPFTIPDIRSLLDAAEHLQCIVALVIKYPSLHYYANGWGDEGVQKEMLSIKTSKLVLWEENSTNRALFYGYDSELLWAQAERELADPERDVIVF